jgi:dUTP pyrophosphatase
MAIFLHSEGAMQKGLHQVNRKYVMDCVSSLDFYKGVTNTGENSGMDLYVPEDTVIPAGQTVFIDHQIKAKRFGPPPVSGILLFPRSSISKTPLRLANSIGLIDPSYRGNIIAAITNTSNTDYTVTKGTRLVQLVLANAYPFTINWVDSLDDTDRGAGGFGSTGQ